MIESVLLGVYVAVSTAVLWGSWTVVRSSVGLIELFVLCQCYQVLVKTDGPIYLVAKTRERLLDVLRLYVYPRTRTPSNQDGGSLPFVKHRVRKPGSRSA